MSIKALLFGLFFMVLSVSGQETYPVLTEIVTDKANIFTPDQLIELRHKLRDFEKQTTNQVVVLTLESLGAETVEQYALGTFNQNRLGQKDKDNGILLLFAKSDREVRIEVGYGLEPYITDAVASRIIRNTMVPKFKEEQYFEGIDLATDQLLTFLTDPEALDEFKEAKREGFNRGVGNVIFIIVFLGVFVAAGGFFFYKGYSGLIEAFRGIFTGKLGVFPGFFVVAFAILPVLFPLIFIVVPIIGASYILDFDILGHYDFLLNDITWILYPIVVLYLVAMIWALIKVRLNKRTRFRLSWFKSSKRYMSKTFSSGGTHSFGSGSSGSSFSSGSSSSFSGGGGSSGGGGASGSW